MITFVRTGNMNDGKAFMALEWALKVAAYINDNYGTSLHVQRNIGGKVNQVHWVNMFESMEEALGLQAKLNQDADYMQLIAESNGQGLFASNSIVDHYYMTIPS